MITNWGKRLLCTMAIALLAGVFGGTLMQQTASADGTGQAAQYQRMYRVAKSKLGSPYVYGVTGPSGFDCSGFTQYVYRRGGNKSIARTAQAQYNSTKKVSKAHRQKGDLVYFGYSKHSISHVGIYVGNGNMINAQNRGVIIEKVASPWWHAVGYSRP